MRKIIVSMMVSVDGFTVCKDPQDNWHNWDEEMGTYMLDFMSTVDAFIYGRKSYEDMISYWPNLDDPFATVMNTKPKLVFSKTLENPVWNATVISKIDPDEITKLKSQPGKDLVIFAGAELVNKFLELDLIDEIRIILNPVLLDGVKPLFTPRSKKELKLKSSQTFSNGNVLLVYNPA